MAHRIRRTGRSRDETIARRIVAVHAFSRENQSTRYRAGDRFRVGLSLACGLIWASAAMGDHDGTFAAAVQYAAGDQPRSVAIADLNGDQVPDLAVANYNSDNVSVLLGVGDGAFATAVNYATGAEPTSVAIGDLNGDQMPDLAVTKRRLRHRLGAVGSRRRDVCPRGALWHRQFASIRSDRRLGRRSGARPGRSESIQDESCVSRFGASG